MSRHISTVTPTCGEFESIYTSVSDVLCQQPIKLLLRLRLLFKEGFATRGELDLGRFDQLEAEDVLCTWILLILIYDYTCPIVIGRHTPVQSGY